MKEARLFVVCGLVQGVGFRYYALKRARERGLAGHVRNLPDGTVEIVAEGEPDALDAMRADLEVGPGPSRVSRVDEQAASPAGRTEFVITR